MKVKITDSFTVPNKGLIFTLNLNDNNFTVIDNKYQIVDVEIEVNEKRYVITEVQKVRMAAPIEWKEDRPIGVVVKEIISLEYDKRQ